MKSSAGAVPGTGHRQALGTDPDLERLARTVRRAGGSVEVTKRTHTKWTLPDGTVLRGGLTMSRRSVRNLVRDIRRALDVIDLT